MDFTSSVPQSQERNYGIFASVDGILALAHFYPLIAVYEEGGWDIETPSPNGDVVYADTAFYIVQVVAPPEQTVIASGVTIDQTRSGEAQTVTFAGGPMRDFYVVSSGHYEAVSRSVGDTMINSYFLPGQQEAGELALQYAAGSLESFNDRYGVYPFTEFDVAPTANQALGIEYPGIVAINLLLYDLDGRLGDIPTSVFFESTVAHEVGHQWFYSLVGNDQLEEPWVDEALTQYATWRYYLDMYGQGGADGFREALVSRLERLERREERSIPIGKAVDEYDLPQYSAIVYGRGPLFFEALAEEIGQETVDEFLRDYALTYRWGIAKSEDLQRLAEAHCVCDLSRLFDEWVYGE
jgi:aminopeptidase N